MAIKMVMKAINKVNSLHSWGFKSLISNYIAKIYKNQKSVAAIIILVAAPTARW